MMTRGAKLYWVAWTLGTVTLTASLFLAPLSNAHSDELCAAGSAAATDVVSAPTGDELSDPFCLAPIQDATDIELWNALMRAQRITAVSASTAEWYASLPRDSSLLAQAVANLSTEPERSIEIVSRVLEIPQPEAVANRAWWLRGEASSQLGAFDEALAAWNQVGETPVDDYLELRRIEGLLSLGETREALERADELAENLAGAPSLTRHYSRELYVHALHQAEDWVTLAYELEEFLDDFGEYPQRDGLLLWLGKAYLGVGRIQDAMNTFDQIVWEFPYRPIAVQAMTAMSALARLGVRAPERSLNARFERGRTLRINKHWAIVDAVLLELLHDVEARGGEETFANEILYDLFQNAYGWNDYDLALVYLQDLVDRGAEGMRWYTVRTKMADTLARLGRIEEGADAIRRRDRGRSEASRHRALADYYYNNGHFTEALQHNEQALSERSQQGWDFSLLLFMAEEYERAVTHFEYLAGRASGRTGRMYQYWLARSLQESGQTERARAEFEAVYEASPRTYYGLQSLNRLNEMDRSLPPLVVEAEPTPVVPASDGTAGDLQDLTENLIREAHLGLTDLVRRELDGPVATSTGSSDSGRFERPARLHWDGPDGIGNTAVELMASHHEVEQPYYEPTREGALADLAKEYGDLFPALERASFLADVGRVADARVEGREATIEFRALDTSFRRRRPTTRRPIELDYRRFARLVDRRSVDTGHWGVPLNELRYPVPERSPGLEHAGERQILIYDNRVELREAFHQGIMDLGDYSLARRFTRAGPDWRSSMEIAGNEQVWSEVYPRSYTEQVTDWAERWGVNPYIVWSLMTVESSHNPDSISRANARGLLQVIPKTGELVAQRMGYWSFGPHDLLNPEFSVEFGCYYFSELMTKFHGQELLAFAGYNGGPHNVARWLEGRGHLPLDAFIETIPFTQARRYAKKVYVMLVLYRTIYFGEDTLYLGNVIDPDYENNIHF